MNGKNYTHVAVGNLNVDIAIYVDRVPAPGEVLTALGVDMRPGGAATNYAVAVAQYGHKVYLVASTSNSEYVKTTLTTLKELGVNVDKIKLVDEFPGLVVIIVQAGGERTMIKYPGANRELSADDVSHDLLENAHLVHMASISPDLAADIGKKCTRRAVLVTYDPGIYADALRNAIPTLIENIDVLFLNERELMHIAKHAKVDVLFKHGLSTLVVKMGQRGATVLLPSGTCYHGVAQPIKRPVDSTGAGDAFNAFFNAKYLESKNLSLALAYGVAAGALKVGFRGSFLRLDHKLFKLQLKKVVVEKPAECPAEFN
ncbi:MAG: PfkB family carbohydrate kinase [Desulfurococcaceae archaeon]